MKQVTKQFQEVTKDRNDSRDELKQAREQLIIYESERNEMRTRNAQYLRETEELHRLREKEEMSQRYNYQLKEVS